MATKKTTKKATTTKATKGKKAEPTFNSFAEALNAPLKATRRTPEERDAAQKRAEAKSREIDERHANEKAKPDAKPKATKKTDAKPKKLSLVAAAYQVLKDAGEPMSCKAIVETAGEKGLWTSPNGKTPHATLYSAILREITTKGNEARFKKTERGQFAAN